jgi:hypothetical protein
MFKIFKKNEFCVCEAVVYVRNSHTWWKSPVIVHDVDQVFVVMISNFYHMLQVSSEDIMQSFKRFWDRLHGQRFFSLF